MAPVLALTRGTWAAVLSGVLVLGLSCVGRTSGGECIDAGDCDPGEDGAFVACVDGSCEEVECLASVDCPIGSYCDTGDDFDCVEGCEDSDDCVAGQWCNDGSCETYGCRSTALDCEFGLVCNTDTGACEEPSLPHCLGCDPIEHDIDAGLPGVCDDQWFGHPDCGGDGSFCLNYPEGSRCAGRCEDNWDCPAGFTCGPVSLDLSGEGCAEDILVLGTVCVATSCSP